MSPQQDVTVLARCAVLATQAPTYPAAGPPDRRQRYKRRQMTLMTDASE